MAALKINRKAELLYTKGKAWLQFKRRGREIWVHTKTDFGIPVVLNSRQARTVAAWWANAADDAERAKRGAK